MNKVTLERVKRRKRRVSFNIEGTEKRPRVSVFASNRYTYAQLIDDVKKKTLASFSSLQLKETKSYQKGKKVEEAKKVGIELAGISKKKGIKEAVFDRGIYAYKGRVKSLAEGLREGGVKV